MGTGGAAVQRARRHGEKEPGSSNAARRPARQKQRRAFEVRLWRGRRAWGSRRAARRAAPLIQAARRLLIEEEQIRQRGARQEGDRTE